MTVILKKEIKSKIFCILFFFCDIDIHYNMTYKNRNRQLNDIKNFACDMLKECKLKVIILSAIIIITFLTGIIIAAKTHSSYENLDSYGIVDVRTGTLTTSFFSRLFSMLFVALIMFLCSFSPYLFPLAVILIAYRAYLLGLNDYFLWTIWCCYFNYNSLAMSTFSINSSCFI